MILVSPITIRLRILKDAGAVANCSAAWRGFTHHDPLEDTESGSLECVTDYSDGFTHHDPLEDTESLWRVAAHSGANSFTHHDPLEDTERNNCGQQASTSDRVSPITIRLRILKV